MSAFAGFETIGGCELPTMNAGEAEFINSALLSTIPAIYEQHGPAVFESTNRAAAVHEAGHCVANSAFGEPVTKTLIEPMMARLNWRPDCFVFVWAEANFRATEKKKR